MRRVAGGETRGNGKAHHIAGKFGHSLFQSRHIQSRRLTARVVMPPRQPHHRVALQSLNQAAAFQIIGIKADEDQRHTAPLPFDQRIGGQGG